MRSTWRVLTAGLATICLGLTGIGDGVGPVWGADARIHADRAGADPRFGLEAPLTLALQVAQEDPVATLATGESSGPSPFLAGLMSAIIPGTGQLIQGQQRGWVYLGVETVGWFSYSALRSAGKQAESDFQNFADEHWDWGRYETVTDCGPGLGPINFEEEKAALEDLYVTALDDFYQDIGQQDVYACGWDDQGNRGSYRSMQGNSDDLYQASELAIGVIVLNHLISAVDAAKSAANRRKSEKAQSLNWQLTPTRQGDLALRVELNRSF